MSCRGSRVAPSFWLGEGEEQKGRRGRPRGEVRSQGTVRSPERERRPLEDQGQGWEEGPGQ